MTDTGDAAVEAGREAHHTAREITDAPAQETQTVTRQETVTETVETDKQ